MEEAGGKVGRRWQPSQVAPKMERWQARTGGIEGNVAWRWQVARSEGGGKYPSQVVAPEMERWQARTSGNVATH